MTSCKVVSYGTCLLYTSGKQYFYAKQYNNALMALQRAYEVASSISAKELICDNYEYLSWVYDCLLYTSYYVTNKLTNILLLLDEYSPFKYSLYNSCLLYTSRCV